MNDLERILAAFKAGDVDTDTVIGQLRNAYFADLEHSTLDLDRARRTGSSEVVYGLHKTAQQIADVVAALAQHEQNVLVTRASRDAFDLVVKLLPHATYHATSRIIMHRSKPAPAVATSVAVVSAGTSDAPVAEEAAITAEFYGNPVVRINDVGVAGLHRLLSRLAEIRTAKVIIVVAGMEGALPSVIGGLVDKPVIAVPTSVGYGAALQGVTALLGMLTSCASGVSVVNIDNGFGAGYLANMLNRL
ncbi:MAG: nickel pincer cofactor biosynthesis protein LarB [Proteobacteria bacterium]|nr:nickel pincer cofactor biosynthesis protein LarB [Pseudomonadota bacterium]